MPANCLGGHSSKFWFKKTTPNGGCLACLVNELNQKIRDTKVIITRIESTIRNLRG